MINCPYCGAGNVDEAEICTACKQSIGPEVDFEEPVRQLTTIANKLIRQEIPYKREFLDDAYRKIMSSVQLIMDHTMVMLQDNLEDLKDMQAEARKDLSAQEFESFQRFMHDFEEAQKMINEGLGNARQSFFEAKSLEDIEKGSIDLSNATAAIQEGLSRLETLTLASSDPALMSLPDREIPYEIEKAIDLIDIALTGVNDFIDTANREQLRESAVALEQARVLILETLKNLDREDEEAQRDDEPLLEEDPDEEEYHDEEEEFLDDGDLDPVQGV